MTTPDRERLRRLPRALTAAEQLLTMDPATAQAIVDQAQADVAARHARRAATASPAPGADPLADLFVNPATPEQADAPGA